LSDKAKELAGKISDLIYEFEEESPDLSGSLDIVNQAGDPDEAEWNLHLDDDEVKIVIELGINAVYISHEQLLEMLSASEFFTELKPAQRRLLISILEREE
jgi:hypothetical protein